MVVPEGALFGSTGAHVELRKKLVEDFDILAVISLPAGVFKPYAGVKTGVLIFRKPTSPKDKGRKERVWFFEVRNDGYDPDKITGGGRPETPDRNDLPELVKKWGVYKASNFKEPPGIKAGALLEPGTEEPRCWWAEAEDIAENDYNLAAGRYKPRVGEAAPLEDPATLIKETIKIEKDIAAGLEALLLSLEPNSSDAKSQG